MDKDKTTYLNRWQEHINMLYILTATKPELARKVKTAITMLHKALPEIADLKYPENSE